MDPSPGGGDGVGGCDGVRLCVRVLIRKLLTHPSKCTNDRTHHIDSFFALKRTYIRESSFEKVLIPNGAYCSSWPSSSIPLCRSSPLLLSPEVCFPLVEWSCRPPCLPIHPCLLFKSVATKYNSLLVFFVVVYISSCSSCLAFAPTVCLCLLHTESIEFFSPPPPFLIHLQMGFHLVLLVLLLSSVFKDCDRLREI